MGEVWEAVPQEVKTVYGMNYMDNLLKGLRSCGSSTHPSVDPVIDALVDAVVNRNPQYRYLVKGGNKLLDFYHVSSSSKPSSFIYEPSHKKTNIVDSA